MCGPSHPLQACVMAAVFAISAGVGGESLLVAMWMFVSRMWFCNFQHGLDPCMDIKQQHSYRRTSAVFEAQSIPSWEQGAGRHGLVGWCSGTADGAINRSCSALASGPSTSLIVSAMFVCNGSLPGSGRRPQ